VTARELESLTERIYRAIWRDLLRALELVRNGAWLPAVERLLLDGDLDGAFRAIGRVELDNALAQIPGRLGPLRDAGFESAVNTLPRALRADSFVRVNLSRHALDRPDVAQAIARQDLSRIQGITAETDKAIREIIARGLREGIHPRKLAGEIKQIVGLTARQAEAVAKYRVRLEKEGRKPDQVERMTTKFANRKLRGRAETIARTEVIRAQSEGRRLQWERQVSEGRLQGDEWEQEWLTARDERTCPICAPMHGQRTPIGGMFESGVGPVLSPPVHPNCRCTVRLVQKGFRAGQDPTPARDAIMRRLGKLK
jgi:SPP1 gp7 family putative phage head morphogenesis protein